MKNKIILLRHGQSVWNLENKFTGWTDVELSEKGKAEAANAGRLIKESGLLPNYYFTSFLRRAIHTLQIAAGEMERDWIPVLKDWHLNERCYGALQGLNKAEVAKEYGEEQVKLWRRGFEELPPVLSSDDSRWPGNDEKYRFLTRDEIPVSESLQDTIARVRCCWEEEIVPRIHQYGDVMIVAHGNSLRGLAMMLLNMSANEVVNLEIPTGSPWVFEVDERMEVIDNYYL